MTNQYRRIKPSYLHGHSTLDYRLHRYRIILALAFAPTTIAWNIILWKSPRDNLASLPGGLCIVRIAFPFAVEEPKFCCRGAKPGRLTALES